MNIVQEIEASTASPTDKVIQLYAVVMLHYRQPLGDAAWEAMKRVTGNESYVEALAFLMGFTLGERFNAGDHGPSSKEWEKLLPKEYATARSH